MANLPVPQRGQPIDFQFIYQIVDTINNLSDSINATSKNINIYTDTGTKHVDLNHLAIDSTYLKVTATSESVDKPVSASYKFQTSFGNAPIVTITPVTNNQKLSVDDDAIVVITNVTTSEVAFKVTFPKATAKNKGSVSVYINAIGISR